MLSQVRLSRVLILVLMEDTLRVFTIFVTLIRYRVLILVLMEDTLRGRMTTAKDQTVIVLILVLMEDTLREYGIITRKIIT